MRVVIADTMVLKKPQPRVESVNLSGAMVRQGENLHHGQRPAYPLRHRGAGAYDAKSAKPVLKHPANKSDRGGNYGSRNDNGMGWGDA